MVWAFQGESVYQSVGGLSGHAPSRLHPQRRSYSGDQVAVSEGHRCVSDVQVHIACSPVATAAVLVPSTPSSQHSQSR